MVGTNEQILKGLMSDIRNRFINNQWSNNYHQLSNIEISSKRFEVIFEFTHNKGVPLKLRMQVYDNKHSRIVSKLIYDFKRSTYTEKYKEQMILKYFGEILILINFGIQEMATKQS